MITHILEKVRQGITSSPCTHAHTHTHHLSHKLEQYKRIKAKIRTVKVAAQTATEMLTESNAEIASTHE